MTPTTPWRELLKLYAGVLCLLVAVLFLVEGGIQSLPHSTTVETVDEITVIHASTWVLGVEIVFYSSLAFVACLLLRSRSTRSLGFLLLLVTVLVGWTITAQTRMHRVVVAPDHFAQEYGFWFAPAADSFAFSDVAFLTVRDGYGGRYSGPVPVLVLHHHDGSTADLYPAGLMKRRSEVAIKELKAAGVAIVR